MRKILFLAVALIFALSLGGCTKPENRADTSIKEGEIKITATVEKVNGNILTLSDGEGGRYSFFYSDEVEVVIDGFYVTDMSADSFKGEKVTVICSSEIMETYPAQLKNERMLIVE